MAEYRFRPIRGVPGGPGQNRTTVVDRSERQLGGGHLNQMLDFSFGGPLSRPRLLPMGGLPRPPLSLGAPPPHLRWGWYRPTKTPERGEGLGGRQLPGTMQCCKIPTLY
jgi:hypothetical protein